jgi:putative transposase
VTLGGRRVAVERPRVRAADGGGKVGLVTYQHFADRDPSLVTCSSRCSLRIG